MYALKGVHVIGVNNIPLSNAKVGYGSSYYGKVTNPNGSFLFYMPLEIQGQNDKDTAISKEYTGLYSLAFKEVPCDEKGNILMISHFLTTREASRKLQIAILCSKEPTHRINLETGKIVSNATDLEYIKDITLGYLVFDNTNIKI